jgi:hypothetical protein
MDVSDASFYIIEKLKIQVAKWGTPKKYLSWFGLGWFMLSWFGLGWFMLSWFGLGWFMLSGFMLSGFMLSVFMLSWFMLSGFMLSWFGLGWFMVSWFDNNFLFSTLLTYTVFTFLTNLEFGFLQFGVAIFYFLRF